MQSQFSKRQPVTMFLAGDVMTGRGIDQVLPHPSDPVLYEPYVRSSREYVEMAERANGPIPKPVDFSYIWGDALEELDRMMPVARIVNLETSVTTSRDYEAKGINYRMHPANIPCLSAAKIDCCVLANNHVLDWGRSGLESTIDTLKLAGIKTAGAGRHLAEARQPAVIETGAGSRILVFGAGTADSGVEGNWAATNSKSGVSFLTDLSDAAVASVAERISAAKRPGDIAILSIHWGGNWGYQIPRQHMLFAHKLIEIAGVDVVHGHSSHHAKGIEIYQNKPILYGCGDFLNDYEGISGHEEFRSNLVLAYFLTMDPVSGNLLSMQLTPFETKRFQLRRAKDQDAAWLAHTLTREGTPVTPDGQGRLTVTVHGPAN
jgi:poly-gamma-glutamate capsule biosynthesis protein CapA/YwtB (metallophosphatase superfamily)